MHEVSVANPAFASLTVEAGELAIDLAVVGALLEILAFVPLILALTDPDLDFDLAVFPVESQRHDRQPLLLSHGGKSANLALVKEEPPVPQRNMELVTGLLVGADVAVVEPELALVDAGVGLADVDLAGADGLHLGALELDPGLVFVRDMVVASGFAISGDIAHFKKE